MTNREFLKAIADSELSAEIKDFAISEIAKLDSKNEKRRNTPNKTQIANEPIKSAILAYVADHPKAIASDIASACEISTQKVSALCKQLIDSGAITVEEVKIPKKGTVKAYTATADDAE